MLDHDSVGSSITHRSTIVSLSLPDLLLATVWRVHYIVLLIMKNFLRFPSRHNRCIHSIFCCETSWNRLYQSKLISSALTATARAILILIILISRQHHGERTITTALHRT